MKKQIVNLISLGTAMAMILLLSECSTKKQEAQKEEGDKMEMPDTKPAEQKATEVKVFENVDASVKTQLNGFLKDYFALNQSLIEDNQDHAKAAAKKLSETVNKFDMSKLMGEQMDFYHLQLAKLNEGLKGISESTDIEETRTALSTVSEGIYGLVKAYHPNESALYYQFCPMAKKGEGANWISSTKEIANPYMGQRMPHCGNTKETIK
jgi:Cu(I)/Ag(I) efflux system membrane fusion protein